MRPFTVRTSLPAATAPLRARASCTRHLALLALATLFVWPLSARPRAAALRSETLRAWTAYVDATEARLAREREGERALPAASVPGGTGASAAPQQPDAAARHVERARALAGEIVLAETRTLDPSGSGRDFEVPGGTIAHWRGTIFVPATTIDRVLARAQHPSERGPFQPDVLALRVLARRPDVLTMFIKMTRQKIVTVTYNTEHEVTWHRDSPTRASSRSVATKIAEVDGTGSGARELPQSDDHGFLWRLNAYWRYEQVPNDGGGVLVQLESLSLSRDIPMGLGMIARPLVTSVARESLERTLIAFRHEQTRADFPACPGCSS